MREGHIATKQLLQELHNKVSYLSAENCFGFLLGAVAILT
jgi:hypothetical protein